MIAFEKGISFNFKTNFNFKYDFSFNVISIVISLLVENCLIVSVVPEICLGENLVQHNQSARRSSAGEGGSLRKVAVSLSEHSSALLN